MPKKDPTQKATPAQAAHARHRRLQSMQQMLIEEHEIACGYLTHLTTQPDINDLPPQDQRTLIQSGLEKYAALAQKMLSVLEKLTDHERTLSLLQTPEKEADANNETPPTTLQWDMLIRHAHRQLKKPTPLILQLTDEDISKS